MAWGNTHAPRPYPDPQGDPPPVLHTSEGRPPRWSATTIHRARGDPEDGQVPRSKHSADPEQPTTAPEADTEASAAPAADESREDTTSRYEPYPGAAFFHGGRHSPIIAAMSVRLHQEGHTDRRLGADWTTAHKRAFASHQESLRPKGGGDTSGIPDQTAWDRLQVPRVSR